MKKSLRRLCCRLVGHKLVVYGTCEGEIVDTTCKRCDASPEECIPKEGQAVTLIIRDSKGKGVKRADGGR